MAAANYQEQSVNENDVSREYIEDAISKAVELRAIHAALMQGNSPSYASPVSRHAPNFSAQDYPVFTPSYEDEPLTFYQQSLLENNPSRNYAENWGDYPFDATNIDETAILSDYRTANTSSRKGLPSEPERHIRLADDQNSVSGFASGPDQSKSRRNSLGDTKSVSSSNKCKHAVINNSDSDSLTKKANRSNIIVPSTDLRSSLHPQTKNKGMSLSWLFPRLKKKNKNKNDNSPIIKNMGMVSVETLETELMEARKSRDTALVEVAGMRSSLGELSQKLEDLENYCEELKKALRQVKSNPQNVEKITKIGKLADGNAENSMPVSNEVMIEGFLQIVSEARLSVKQFCKTLVKQIDESDHTLFTNLNSLLQPYKLSLNSKYSKAILYHFEAFVNQSFYQDFENCVFRKNGMPKLLDPRQERESRFQSFVALRNLSWNEVLRKGTKCYSREFSDFCDEKMSGIIETLGWTRPWPEQLLHAFFVAAKCIWLVHLLAFSFRPPLGVLRVDENRVFEARYMEDVFADKQRAHGASRVKIMVMPGFYVHDEVIRCKVVCRYKSVV